MSTRSQGTGGDDRIWIALPATLYFGANDVMTFLGRKLTGHFLGKVVTDHFHVELQGKRIPGRRVKHRVKCNWIKMYDRGPVLRVETVPLTIALR